MKTFEQLNLIEPIQRALVHEKYITPTPIQAQTIPPALEGNDILGCAQTGTGKTAAFALPILNKLGKQNRKAKPNRPAALVLAPTRELAIQIGDSFEKYSKHLKLRVSLVYGGVSQVHQVRVLNRGVHILVATPGRLLDLMNQGHIQLDQLEIFTLDEADRMLDMGFLPDIKKVIKQLPQERQSLFFSATLHPKIVSLSQTLLQDPVSFNVSPKKTSVETIEQRILFVKGKGKIDILKSIIDAGDVDRALVFTRTKRTAESLSKQLARNGIKTTAIHGNKTQNARQRALEAFRKKRVEVLVATDVAARGIDIDNISHVINFDMPVEPDSYVHRIGRTGRAGAEGIALSFCTPNEQKELRAIEKLIGHKIPVDPDHSELSPSEKSASPRHRTRTRTRSRTRTRTAGQDFRSKKRTESAEGSESNQSGSKKPFAKRYGSKRSGGKRFSAKKKTSSNNENSQNTTSQKPYSKKSTTRPAAHEASEEAKPKRRRRNRAQRRNHAKKTTQ